MAKNIEMNHLNESGGYEIVYPKTIPDQVENLLLNDTKTFMGLETTSTPDDAFRKLYLTNVLNGKSVCYLTFIDSETQQPLPNVIVTCDLFCDAAGTAMTSYTTNEQGKIIAFVSNINPTIKITNYVDIADFSQTLDVDALGKEFEWNFELTTYNFRKYIASTTARVSGNVVKIDVTAVGGGGGGGGGYGDGDGTDRAYGGGGGGGGYCSVKEQVSFNITDEYPLVVGAGGTLGRWRENGGRGGQSSFLGVSANGGAGGTGNGTTSAVGNGAGGAGTYSSGTVGYGKDGIAGSVAGYSSFTETVIYGGGGGSGTSAASTGTPDQVKYGFGAGYGGNGGIRYSSASSNTNNINATAGKDGFGGGGGGGGNLVTGNDPYSTSSAKGGDGCIAVRMYLKSQGY